MDEKEMCEKKISEENFHKILERKYKKKLKG